MSLLRLLKTGKSLVDFGASDHAYRMRHKNPLPKFNASKNPFAPKSDAPTAESATPAPVPPSCEGNRLTSAEKAAANLKDTAPLPQLSATALATAQLNPPPARREPGLLRRWMNRLNPFRRRPRPVGEPRPTVAVQSRAPVQGELSLDKIKVVRNDLTEADVELVPVRPAAVKQREAAAGPPGKSELAETRLG